MMPSARVQAATETDRPLAALAEEVREASNAVLDAFDAGDLAVDLRAVLACSVAALSAHAARVFRLLGLTPGPDIGLAAAASLTAQSDSRVNALLRELVAAHLVHEHVPGRYRMHDLVRHYAAEEAHERHDAREGHSALHRVLDHYLHHAYASGPAAAPTSGSDHAGSAAAGRRPGAHRQLRGSQDLAHHRTPRAAERRRHGDRGWLLSTPGNWRGA